METILAKIIMPSNVIAEVNATLVTLPGKDGVFGVMPGHTRLIANLKPGVVKVMVEQNEKQYFIFAGVAEITGTEINIITEFAINLSETTKTVVMDNINDLETELKGEEPESVEASVINAKISQYKSLLEFI
ncbi:MAG: ATP synthase F1 subunit epsilon [Rickettsiaceae bacterium]|nr:ATP synthase F1 subunit epsilon [Rickettsiaceae bacterium]